MRLIRFVCPRNGETRTCPECGVTHAHQREELAAPRAKHRCDTHKLNLVPEKDR